MTAVAHSTSPLRVGVTGATGLVGGAMARAFAARGWTVRGFVRDPESAAARALVADGIACERMILPSHIDAASLRALDVLVHAAYATRATTPEDAERVNEAGTARLFEVAREAGVPRVVFVSSLSAHATATSYYGRSKLAWEERLLATGALIVRPGLVLARSGGLAARLWRLVERLPVVPLIDGGRQQLQTVHIDDLAAATLRAIEAGATGRLTIAEPDGITLRELVREMAASRGRHVRFLSVPASIARAGLRLAAVLHLPLGVTTENLDGLLAPATRESTAELVRMGITVRAATESLRALTAEPRERR